VGATGTEDQGGYWEVASDGGVFAFGDATFSGSMGGRALDAPVVGMAPDPTGAGYWEVASDGGVFAFGDARFSGSMGGRALDAPVVGMAGAAGGTGYWLAEGAPLTGKVVTIDPGHDGGNAGDPSFMDQAVWNGTGMESCDTAGTATDGGYPEHEFNFEVATALAADLRAEGAAVVLTRTSDTGVGPCVPERAAIGNEAHSAAAVSIHADGGPAGGRGFAVLEPVADGINDAIVGPSAVFGADLRDSFAAVTGEPTSTYDGVDGIQPRGDLGGLNLSTVPKVLIECANMRNPADAALVVDPGWQQLAARGIAAGITTFLTGAAG
ncbi:MAG: N-acetylmuramoyl-L-alanine amidase, partial [Acidimicrobiales bacterium]